MSATQKGKPSPWQKIIKQQIKGLNKTIVNIADDEDIPIVVRPPEPPPVSIFKQRKQSSLELYLNRKRFQNVQKTINLVQENRPSKNNDSLKILDDEVDVKPVQPPSLQKKANEKEVVVASDVINLDQKSQKVANIEKYRRKVFGNSYKPIEISVVVPPRNTENQLKKQLKTIQQMNKPEWVRQKEERKAINKQKYPNSFTHSYDFDFFGERFSGLGSHSDKQHQQYLQKRQQDRLKNKEKREIQKTKKKAAQQQKKKKQVQEKNAEYASIINSLVEVEPKKKIKQNQCLNEVEIENQNNKEEGQLANIQALQVAIGPEYSGAKQVVQIVPKRQKRVGAKDTIKYQSEAPNLINMILKHNYGEQVSKLQTKKLPDIFPDSSTYQKMFHYMISNQSIAQISHKLRAIQKGIQTPLKIVINQVKSNHDGQVELALSQQETTQYTGIQLKNHSFSKMRIGLICSSKEYCKQYYGIPGQNKKQFGFLVLLVNPTSSDEANKEVRAKARIKSSNLEDMLHYRKTKQAYFFDLDKLSTIIREYLAISNVVCSDLANSILDPSQVEKEVGNFIQKKQDLDNILNYLKQIYNQTQWQSIREMVLREKGFVLLQGPPGTGKTSTLMGLLSAQYELLKKTDNRKIMICAPSNAAVDHIAKRIINQGLMTGEGECIHPKILRTGIVETQDQNVKSVSLDDQCEKIMISLMEQTQKMDQMSTAQIKQKIVNLQKEMHRLAAKNRDVERQAKKQLLIQCQKKLYEFKKTKHITSKAKYNSIEDNLLSNAEIVLTTLASSGNDKIDKIRGQIACLIVDQAAQATEPNLLIALQTGVQKVILIGDPYQLPATVKSPDANVTLFNRSLFQRFLDANIKPYFLNIQYRMSPMIRSFPSSRFYHDRLIDGQTVLQRPIPSFLKNFENRNVIFIDLKYGKDYRKGDSFYNQAQVKVITLIIRCLIDPNLTLGLITPYQAQKRAIYRSCMNQLKEYANERNCFQKQVMINTVDSFQGQQKDIIIVSTVRANPSYNVGFLTDQRRINVTLTRAKHLLIVIGNGDTLGSNQVWDDFLSWTERKRCYYQISQSIKMQNIIGNMFQNFYLHRIRRVKHKQLSTDIRNLHRNQIQSKDFRTKKQPQILTMINQSEKAEILHIKPNNQKQDQAPQMDNKQKKYAMDIKDSEQILKDKKKKEDLNKQFQNMLQRMKKLQQENYEKRFF